MTRASIAFVAAACLWAAAASSSPPSPYDSYVDPCIVTCPAGDSAFTVIARNFVHLPYAHGRTTVHLCECPGVRLAPVPDGARYTVTDGCLVSLTNGEDGVANFRIEAGGVCAGASIVVDCNGVLFATRTAVASFDQDGDWDVDVADVMAVSAKVGFDDPTADFDCDGAVTALDRELAIVHFGHAPGMALATGLSPESRLSATPVPNPARGRMEFVLRVPVAGAASLSVHDPSGRRLASVLDGALDAGVHRAAWSGESAEGRRAAPGLYFYRFAVGGQVVRGTIVVAR